MDGWMDVVKWLWVSLLRNILWKYDQNPGWIHRAFFQGPEGNAKIPPPPDELGAFEQNLGWKRFQGLSRRGRSRALFGSVF